MVNINLGINQDYQKLPFWERLLHNRREHIKCKNSIFAKDYNNHFLNPKIIDEKLYRSFFEKEQERLKQVVKQKTKQKSYT